MKAEELRINNQIKQGIVSMIGYENGIFGAYVLEHLFDSSGGKFIEESELKPIPLTEEWLKNFGFVKSDNNIYVLDDWIILSVEDGDWGNPCIDIKVKGVYLTCIQHVHQIQNFYYALTGQELTLKKLKK